MGTKGPNIEKMDAQIKEWGAKIESLLARAEMAGEHVKADYRRQVEELKAKRLDAQARLDEFRAAGGEAWEAFRTGLEGAWKDLETSLKNIRHEDASPKPPTRLVNPRTPPSSSGFHAAIPKPQARHRTSHR